MSASDDLFHLAALCSTAAHELLEALVKLGPRPSGPEPDILLWDQTHLRLQSEISGLTALGSKLSAASVVAALEDIDGELDELRSVTKNAKRHVEEIAEMSQLLTVAARLLDIGISVLKFAASPGASSAKLVHASVAALSKELTV